MMAALRKALGECGLHLNDPKSLYVPLVPRGGNLVIPQNTHDGYSVGIARATPAMVWRYLGLTFGPYGIRKPSTVSMMRSIDRILGAHLTLMRKVEAIRGHVGPSFIHQLVLGMTSVKELQWLDRSIRKRMRILLALPHDIPNAYFYAPVADRGMGLMEFSVTIPQLRRTRVAEAKRCLYNEVEEDNDATRDERRKARAMRWHQTTDGRPLRAPGRWPPPLRG
ncbi:hypothetical protein GE061_001092 [Apolygus lucorum]|uniref:Reverse transcriptase domain-containing protein n=1 Tax=Apolygus lucorum TaxID=248454 RepID=A0A6A4KLA4_APOLU|nr:hypothetical protein GE061_001092 [Apolygus lucorum]